MHAPVWRSAASTYATKLHVAGTKLLRTAVNATGYIRNEHIHEDLNVPTSANHVRAQTESFDWKLAGAGTWKTRVTNTG